MKKIFFTPGPSQLYPTFNLHLKDAIDKDIPSISHRSQLFKDLYKNTSEKLKELLNIPKNYHVFFTSSSIESMERVIENCVKNTSFHFVNGAFSKKFYEIAKELGKKTLEVEVVEGEGFDLKSIKIPKQAEIICLTQNETSTGVSIETKDIYFLKRNNPNKILAIDIVSSAPYVDINFKKIDIAFFSVQKGFGLPSGLGVLIVNNKAIEKAKQLKKMGKNIGTYHNFVSLLNYEEKFQTFETPNSLYIYLLGKICEDMKKKGIKKIRRETEEKADMIYNFFTKHPEFSTFVKDKSIRSKTTAVINTFGKSKEIISKLSEKGFVVGSGYGKFKDNQIRIANFPAHSIMEVKNLIDHFNRIEK